MLRYFQRRAYSRRGAFVPSALRELKEELGYEAKPEEFTLQESEVSEVVWFDFRDCMEKVEKNEIAHCIFMEELQILDEKLFGY